MNNEHSILIVDSNVAFATLLKEGLEQGGGYRAMVTSSGTEALQALPAAEFDLAIVDLGLTDTDGITLARALRQQKPAMRLVLIPLDGADVPVEASDLDVQGVLTKPFFLPELSGHIADALARPIGDGAADTPVDDNPGDVEDEMAEAASSQVAVGEGRAAEIIQEMAALLQDINAEAVILTHGEKLIAHTGRLSAEEVNGLAQAVAESWRTSARVAQILGQEQLRFEQSMEGGKHLFYSLAVAEEVILSVALRANVPLGMIRHRTKAAADALRPLMGIVG
jgi:CheY-like chemotaxis protein